MIAAKAKLAGWVQSFNSVRTSSAIVGTYTRQNKVVKRCETAHRESCARDGLREELRSGPDSTDCLYAPAH